MLKKINIKKWLILIIAILLLMAWVGFIDEDAANESRAFLRELRRIF